MLDCKGYKQTTLVNLLIQLALLNSIPDSSKYQPAYVKIKFENYLVQLSIYMFPSQITAVPAKSDSDVMFCLQSYQGLRIHRSLVY